MNFIEALETLGLSPNAGHEAARSAYVARLRRHLADDDPAINDRLARAYAVLKDPAVWEAASGRPA